MVVVFPGVGNDNPVGGCARTKLGGTQRGGRRNHRRGGRRASRSGRRGGGTGGAGRSGGWRVRPQAAGGMRVATTTGAMVVAGSARTADRIRWRLDIAAEICSPTAVHPPALTPDRACDLEDKPVNGLDGRGAA